MATKRLPPLHSQKVASLDLLRIGLMLSVLLCHYGCIGHNPDKYLSHPGALGVTGFFVLSGYLLAQSFQRLKGGLDLAAFYQSKAKRLLPMLIIGVLLGIACAPAYIAFTPEYHIIPQGVHLTDYPTYYNGATWFMWKLLLFIALAPQLYYIFKRKRLSLFCVVALIICCLYLFGYKGVRFHFHTLLHLTSFACGMLAANFPMLANKSTRCLNICLCLSFLVPIVFLIVDIGNSCFFFSPGRCSLTFRLGLTLYFFLVIPLWEDASTRRKSFSGSLISYAATLTYPVYLIHMPLMDLSLHITHLWRDPFVDVSQHCITVGISFIVTLLGAMGLVHLDRKNALYPGFLLKPLRYLFTCPSPNGRNT